MMQSLKNGTQLGDFTIIRLIAKGGMGEVYEAHEGKLQRRVALKIISDTQADDQDLEDLKYRFVSEARTLARVNHPNVVTIYTIDDESDRPFIAMEFVDGVSFRHLLEEFTFSVDGALPLFEQMLDGLKSLHDNQILHRDLKPHNVLLRTDGQIKILDFGIAKHASAEEYTRTGIIVGTLPYMPPELRTGTSATEKSDIWSLGSIFYECLTGLRLVDAYNHSEINYPEELIPRIPSEIRRIIACMCAKKPNERYRSVNEALEDLRRFRSTRQPVSAAIWATLSEKVNELASAARAKQDQESPPSEPEKRSPQESRSQTLKNPKSRGVRTDKATPSHHGHARAHSQTQQTRPIQNWLLAGGAVAALSTLAFVLFMPPNENSLKPGQTTQASSQQPTTPSNSRLNAPPEPQIQTLTEPVDKKVIYIEPSHAQFFKWSQVVTPQTYRVQIATDEKFKSLVINEWATGNSIRLEKALSEGKYHWRLWSPFPQLPTPPAMSFVVQHLGPVNLALPADKAAIRADKSGKAEVALTWKCKPGFKNYIVQWTTIPDFSGSIEEKQVNGCQLKNVLLAGGFYYWRVRQDLVEALDVWSSVRQFSIRGGSPSQSVSQSVTPTSLPAPRISRKSKPFTLVLKNRPRDLAGLGKNAEELPKINWRPVKGAQQYLVQISSSKDFSALLTEQTLNSNSMEWTGVIPGHFNWRVAALNSAGKRGAFSELGELRVHLPSPQLNKVYNFLLPTGSQEKVHIEWNTVPLASKYIVEISPHRNLASAEKIVTKSPRLPIGSMPAQYFVHVAAANEAGEPISAYSDTAKLQVSSSYALQQPQTLQPTTGSKVPTQNGRISIVFSWSRVANAESYTLELATDPGFKKILERRNTKNRGFLFQQAQIKSRVYWRVRANTFSDSETRSPSSENTSPWSEAAYFDVK